MIAHRLASLLDFDQVAVLDKGRLVEFGEPNVLLGRAGSAFAKLYRGSSSQKARKREGEQRSKD